MLDAYNAFHYLCDTHRFQKIFARADLVLVTGVGYPKTGNYMNLIQTHYVGDLCETLGWKD